MAVVTQEAPKRSWVMKGMHDGIDQEAFLDRVSAIAVREGTDVEIRDSTRAERTGKDYWGPDISVLSLSEAKGRVSSGALDRRIAHQKYIILRSSWELHRLEEIRAELYGQSQGSEGQPRS